MGTLLVCCWIAALPSTFMIVKATQRYNGTRNEAGNASIVDMLLQNGASDHCNFRGETALKLARDDHCYNIERVLLKAHGLSWIPPYVFTAAGSAHRLTRGTALTGSSILLSI